MDNAEEASKVISQRFNTRSIVMRGLVEHWVTPEKHREVTHEVPAFTNRKLEKVEATYMEWDKDFCVTWAGDCFYVVNMDEDLDLALNIWQAKNFSRKAFKIENILEDEHVLNFSYNMSQSKDPVIHKRPMMTLRVDGYEIAKVYGKRHVWPDHILSDLEAQCMALWLKKDEKFQERLSPEYKYLKDEEVGFLSDHGWVKGLNSLPMWRLFDDYFRRGYWKTKGRKQKSYDVEFTSKAKFAGLQTGLPGR